MIAARQDQLRVFVIVLLVNAILFLVELSAGLFIRSTALTRWCTGLVSTC
jgi:Co/Zn/Cd efflux system component